MSDRTHQGFASRRRLRAAYAVVCLGCIVVGVQAYGQEQDPLIRFGLSFSGSYAANDPKDDDFDLRTGLSFDLRRATDSQSFAISANGRFANEDDGGGFTFQRPSIGVNYDWSNQSTAVGLGLNYSIRDVSGIEEIIDPVTGDVIDLIDDDGTLQSLNLNAGLETGRGARFGTDTTFRYTSRTYSGTNDPSLDDLESWRIGTALRFELDPRITARTTASYGVVQEEDERLSERRTLRFGVGADFEIDPLWSASVNVNRSQFEREQRLTGVTTSSDERIGFSTSVRRQFRDGDLRFSLARNQSEDGAQESFTVSRQRSLPGDQSLNWSLSLVSFPNGDLAPAASVRYARPTAHGDFVFDLRQASTIDGNDNVVTTSLGVDYRQTINSVSSWSLNGRLSQVDVLGSENDDQARASVGLTYNRALTRDWNLAASLSQRVAYEGAMENNRASVVSLSLQRSFAFRP